MREWIDWVPAWSEVAAFFNSSFSTALFGSVAGAFGGAWAAQRIAEKAKTRELLIKEVRQTNAAATMLNSIANTYIGLKKQHVKKLHDNFFDERAQMEAFKVAYQAGRVPPRQAFDYKADMETLTAPYTPVEHLSRLIFEEASPAGGVLFVAPLLFSSIQGLIESFETRNDIIREWKQDRPAGEKFAAIYFGFKQENVVDQRYKSVVEAIYLKTDEVISFSMMLAEAFLAHANKQRDQYVKRFGRSSAPRVSTFDFSQAEPYLPQKDDDLLHFERMLKQERVDQGTRQHDSHTQQHPYRQLWNKVFLRRQKADAGDESRR